MTAFGAFLRKPSTVQFLRSMVRANLALDSQLRADGLMDYLDAMDEAEQAAKRRHAEESKAATS